MSRSPSSHVSAHAPALRLPGLCGCTNLADLRERHLRHGVGRLHGPRVVRARTQDDEQSMQGNRAGGRRSNIYVRARRRCRRRPDCSLPHCLQRDVLSTRPSRPAVRRRGARHVRAHAALDGGAASGGGGPLRLARAALSCTLPVLGALCRLRLRRLRQGVVRPSLRGAAADGRARGAA